MALKITVNGTDRSQWADQATWTISQNWSRQGDTATIYLADEHPDSPLSLSYTVSPLATIVLTDTTLNTTLFSGVVTTPKLTWAGPNLALWELACADWTYLADRAVVVGDYLNQTADAIVKSLTSAAACGITTNNVQAGPTIPRAQFIYDSLSNAWTKITKLASLTATYGWYVDENQDLHFYPLLNAVSSGWTFTDLLTDTGAGYAHYDTGWDYLWDASSIRNSATVRGASYDAQQSDLFVGNGSQASWPLTYTPNTSNLKPTLTVGGVTKTVGTQDGTGATTQWVIVQSASGSWFLTPNTDPVPASSTVISFTYTYQAPVLSRAQDQASITKFHSLPNGGVFGIYIADTSLQSVLTAKSRGQREIHTYSEPQERAEFTTTADFSGHVRAGQLITFKSRFVPDSLNSYNPGINDNFLVLQNRISGSPGLYRTYQITAVRASLT